MSNRTSAASRGQHSGNKTCTSKPLLFRSRTAVSKSEAMASNRAKPSAIAAASAATPTTSPSPSPPPPPPLPPPPPRPMAAAAMPAPTVLVALAGGGGGSNGPAGPWRRGANARQKAWSSRSLARADSTGTTCMARSISRSHASTAAEGQISSASSRLRTKPRWIASRFGNASPVAQKCLANAAKPEGRNAGTPWDLLTSFALDSSLHNRVSQPAG
mmetsp:Transcript_89988/g.234526  ORF Transcript_89988/g.234526 Transcript_89988/m.234526 type:complete len:216 (-) Transcript_89988:436-1083(-)